MKDTVFRVLDIVKGTTVDGPGFRTAIYFAGCRHGCPGCHNPQSWDFEAGEEMTLEKLLEIIDEEDFDVTLTGGDPLYHPKEIADLSQNIKKRGHSVWLYTGFTIEEVMDSDILSIPLPYLDVIIDGPFIEALRDPDLRFRGSSNQRIIQLHNGKPISCIK